MFYGSPWNLEFCHFSLLCGGKSTKKCVNALAESVVFPHSNFCLSTFSLPPLAWLVQVKPLLTDTSIIRTHQPRSQGLSGTGETLGTRLHIFWTVHLAASFDPLSLKSDENEILFTLSLLVQTFKWWEFSQVMRILLISSIRNNNCIEK